jgi:hypothetical protein
MKYNRHGQLAEVWEAAVAGVHLFVPHKVILNAARNFLYVADRENMRIISFDTSKGGHGNVLSNAATLEGRPFAISFNSSASDWPMLGVFGGGERLMGFSVDADGNKIGTWGPQEVCFVCVLVDLPILALKLTLLMFILIIGVFPST